MTVTRTYFPWYRQGFSTALTGRPAATAGRAPLPASVTLRGSALTFDVPAELAGPGDVIGLDPAEVRRTEPFDGCVDFEPSFFPYIEFTHPDLPWRFSPFGPENSVVPGTTHSVLRPWLMLVVVPADDSTLAAAAPGGLPVLTADAAELPNPAEAWAWAHVQVAATDTEKPADLLGDPSRATARVICPRRLLGGTGYRACLVPAFAAGRSALGLGPPSGQPLDPAWSGAGPVQLPVYFQWAFNTSQAGSFETFASRLRPRSPSSIPGMTSGRVIDVSNPGWGAAASAGATVIMQGALRPLGLQESNNDPVLAASLRAAVSAAGGGVQLRPPLYGQDYQGGTTAVPANDGWLAELNTDPRRRIAAGLAAWAITVEQEDLVDRAWQQLGEVRDQSGGNPDLAQIAGAAIGARTQTVATGAPPALLRMTRAGGPSSAAGGAAALVNAATAVANTAAGLARTAAAAANSVITRTAATSTEPTAPGRSQFAPKFREPGYMFLRAVADEWLLPGADKIPADSVMLVQTNPAFVEAFLAGLNHAMARELNWRRYPVLTTGTMFRTFWTAYTDETGSNEYPELSKWEPDTRLGSHTSRPDQLILLIRGALLRRFPTAAIYLSQLMPDGTESHLPPNLRGNLGGDLAFFGFPRSPQEVLAVPAGGSRWSVVIQESVQHSRFGVDDPPESGTGAATSWQDLNWGEQHFQAAPGQPVVHVPVAGPLLGSTRPVSDGSQTTAVWGASCAHLAVALQQPAFRIRIPAALWLQPLVAELPH